MEPNKFEQQIKDKLEGRTIQPSVKSWDRLDAMLTVEVKPKRKTFAWYYIAASLFFVFGISYWFVNQDSSEIIPEHTIVTSDDKNSLETNKVEHSKENEIKTDELIEEVKQKDNSVIVQNYKSQKIKTDTEIKDNSFKNEEVLVSDKVVEEMITDLENKKQEMINNKSNYISPEKLLASVENNEEKISITHSNSQESTLKVDANTLLLSVESEISEEYRETTFDKLKRKFNQAKTAVANRNYE